MRMNFKYKCCLQNLFSVLPKGEMLNYFFQKHVTKTLPISDREFLSYLTVAKKHFDYLNKYCDIDSVSCYEFGAGWELANPISLSLLGVKYLYCIDIRDLIVPYLLNDTVLKLYRLKEDLPFECSLPEQIPDIRISNYKEVLHDYFGINYTAPADARDTCFKEGVHDLIVSNVTFEHIPKDDIVAILNECYRVLKPGGILSARIDYQDHWSYFDSNLSVYEFLKYSSAKWKIYNPSLHYQNRLRHKDYIEIISKTDFEVLEDNVDMPSSEGIQALKSMKIDDYFLNNYSFDELAVRRSWMVLRK